MSKKNQVERWRKLSGMFHGSNRHTVNFRLIGRIYPELTRVQKNPDSHWKTLVLMHEK